MSLCSGWHVREAPKCGIAVSTPPVVRGSFEKTLGDGQAGLFKLDGDGDSKLEADGRIEVNVLRRGVD